MGIHIKGDQNEVNVVHGNVIYGAGVTGHPSKPPIFSLAFLALILVTLIIKFWWVALILASVGAIAFGTWLEREEKRRVQLERQRRAAALSARAEDQNSAYLRGEARGVYGQFPPPPGVGL